MDSMKKRTTTIGIITLIIGLLLGVGIGVWGIRDMSASSGATTASANAGSTASASPAARSESQSDRDRPMDKDQSDLWDPFAQMERMQQEIDRAIRDATERFQLGPGATAFRPDMGYASSFDLRDRKDHFEVRAYLPDAEASDVNVKIDNDRTLRVTVGHKKQEVKNDPNAEARITELGQYEQVVTLPEPVNSADMKIDRKGHEVVITIPKANKNS